MSEVRVEIMRDHSYVFQKIDDAIYKVLKCRFDELAPYASAGHVIMAMNDHDVALVTEDGALYYSNRK
jgi:hypothetical protein